MDMWFEKWMKKKSNKCILNVIKVFCYISFLSENFIYFTYVFNIFKSFPTITDWRQILNEEYDFEFHILKETTKVQKSKCVDGTQIFHTAWRKICP